MIAPRGLRSGVAPSSVPSWVSQPGASHVSPPSREYEAARRPTSVRHRHSSAAGPTTPDAPAVPPTVTTWGSSPRASSPAGARRPWSPRGSVSHVAAAGSATRSRSRLRSTKASDPGVSPAPSRVFWNAACTAPSITCGASQRNMPIVAPAHGLSRSMRVRRTGTSARGPHVAPPSSDARTQ